MSGSIAYFIDDTEYIAFGLFQPFEKGVGEGLSLTVPRLCAFINKELVLLLFNDAVESILPLFGNKVTDDISVVFVEFPHFVVPFFK